MIVLETNNLTLSLCTPDDRSDFIDLERDPEVMHFLNGGAVDHENTDPDKVTFLMPRGTEPYVWTARRRETGDFVGWFCLYPETKKLAEIGYRLRRNAWGQGLASEGAATLVDWGFNHAGYESVMACTMTANYGSRRVMEKIGMRHTKTVSLDAGELQGGEHGEVWYEVTRREWADKRGRSNSCVENIM
jgi:RimJ/RimL family protein N-acetyltransferase